MIVFKVNILEELKKAGYSTYRLRMEKLLGESTIQRLRTSNVVSDIETIEKICRMLNFEIGDLIEIKENIE